MEQFLKHVHSVLLPWMTQRWRLWLVKRSRFLGETDGGHPFSLAYLGKFWKNHCGRVCGLERFHYEILRASLGGAYSKCSHSILLSGRSIGGWVSFDLRLTVACSLCFATLEDI